MYNLYFNKEKVELKIKKVSNEGSRLRSNYPSIPTQFNDNYWICLERKPLKEIARRIQTEWRIEAEQRLSAIKNLKI